jgi:succinate dehydrogenase hydrophobic anchor subunit
VYAAVAGGFLSPVQRILVWLFVAVLSVAGQQGLQLLHSDTSSYTDEH